VDTHPDVELILSAVLHQILVTADTGSLHGLRGQLFQFSGHKMDRQRELIDTGLLSAKVKNTDLGVRDTTVEPRLGVRLVLTISITPRWSTTHFVGRFFLLL